MSDRSVTIDLFGNVQANIESIIGELKKNLEIKKFLEPIVDEAVERAREEFAGTGIAVDKAETEVGYQIIGSGNHIGFIEFGAGTQTDVGHPLKTNVPFPVEPGSWSRLHAQQFSRHGYWVFGGKRFEYITPHSGMLKAHETLVARLT